MAPDASAASAGRKLAKAASWKSLGQSDRAFWGECQGSALYQTQVSALDLATRCSCPSRKFPCKHALGLLFLIAEARAAIPVAAAEPEWVASWLAKRDAAQQRKQARAEEKPVDARAQAKRAHKRQANVLAGVEQLETWMCDLVRSGLGRLPSEGFELWDAQARRLVDAQAPGLASRVRAIGSHVGAGEAWSERVLGELGRLALLTHAYRRLDALPADLQADVRRLVGFTLDHAEVLAHGARVEDEWVVASSTVVEEERLRVLRAWLVGVTSGRRALVLEVTAGAARFQQAFVAGSAFRASLVFFPGSCFERALIAERLGAVEMGRIPPHGGSITRCLDDYADLLARNPWLDRTLVLLDGVRVVPARDAGWYAVDREGLALPLADDRHETLYALSGGHPLLLAAEWDGFELDPLSAFHDGRCVALKGSVP